MRRGRKKRRGKVTKGAHENVGKRKGRGRGREDLNEKVVRKRKEWTWKEGERRVTDGREGKGRINTC